MPRIRSLTIPSIFLVGPKSLRSRRPPGLEELHKSGEAKVDFFQAVPTRIKEGAKVFLMKPRDVNYLYRRAHEVDCCVLYNRDVRVALDPRNTAKPTRRQTRKVPSYLRYKACCVPASNADWWSEFQAWRESTGRHDGFQDPRCLPFHIYDFRDGVPTLDTAAQRRSFDAVCGKASSRIDASNREWQLKSSRFEGRPPPLRLCGRDLPVGMHWDVQNQSRSSIALVTSIEVWRIPSGEYLNVAPNGHVRCSPARSTARRIYPTRSKR